MPLDDLVKINISAATATPSQQGFGTILIAAQKVPAAFTARTRLFGSLTEMTDYGFLITDPAYLCAQRMKAQNPSITSWKVGRRANKNTQALRLRCISAVQGDVYNVKIGAVTIAYTVLAAATTSTVATAIGALITGSGTVVVATNNITVTQTAASGTLIDVSAWSTNLEVTDMTADPGLAADLAAIVAADSDWYGLALDSNAQTEVVAAALFAEANKKLFLANTSDIACEDPASATDVMFVLKASAYVRTATLYSRSQLLSYSGAAWMAKQFTQAPGSDTWKFKTLAAVTVDSLSAAGRVAILAKNGNIYTATSSINITEEGKSASGEWIDTTRGIDWLRALIQFLLFSAFVNNGKIPFTDAGTDLIAAIIDGGLDQGVSAGLLAPGSTSVFVPKALAVPSADRAARKLTGVRFAGRLAGAIHELTIDGTITV